MSYDLVPNDTTAGVFAMGVLSWPVLLEACGYLFPCIHNGGRWHCMFGVDDRMGTGEYPLILTNDGFPVTEEEARIMARIARNYVATQRLLPEDNESAPALSKEALTRDDAMNAMRQGLFGGNTKWPLKVRTDIVDRIDRFADWADKSQGFCIH